MTYYDIIKNMDIEAMAVLFTIIISNTEQKFLTKLSDANISYDFYSLSFEHQVELYKAILESEYEIT